MTVIIVLALATLGDTIKLEIILSMLCCPKWPRQVQPHDCHMSMLPTVLLTNVANGNDPLHVKDHLHWRHLLAKPSATVTHDCTCLGHLGQYKSQGEYIQHYIAGVIMHNIALNIANVNSA